METNSRKTVVAEDKYQTSSNQLAGEIISTKVYLDVSTLMANWLSENKRLVYLPERFDQLMENVRTCEYSLVFSWMQEKEISKRHSFLLDYFNRLVKETREINKAVFLAKKLEQVEEAKSLYRKYASLHFSDAIHLALAKKNAEIMVTEDQELFEIAGSEMKAKHIEELV